VIRLTDISINFEKQKKQRQKRKKTDKETAAERKKHSGRKKEA
jgi:hypothetical protein